MADPSRNEPGLPVGKLIGVVIIAIAVGWFLYARLAGPPAGLRAADRQLRDGLAAAEAGRFEEGLALMKQAAERAHRLRQSVGDEETVRNLERLEADAWHYRAAYALRTLQIRTRAGREAAKAAGEPWALPPDALAEPEADIRRSLAIDPGRPEAHFVLGLILREKGALGKALESFREALNRSDKPFPKAQNALGEVYYVLQEYDRAREHYNLAVQLDPDYAAARLNLGLYYANRPPMHRSREEVELARKHLGRYLELAADRADASEADVRTARSALADLPDAP